MSEQVHIRVGETRHEKWVNHAEAEYDGNMSKLIRNAVENEIGGAANGGAAPDGAQTVEANGRIDDILNGVEDNEGALEAIEDRLKNMHDTMLSQSGVPQSVLSTAYGVLDVTEGEFEDADGEALANQFGLTPSEVAELGDISENEARRALTELYYEYDDMEMYRNVNYDEPLYWRNVGVYK